MPVCLLAFLIFAGGCAGPGKKIKEGPAQALIPTRGTPNQDKIVLAFGGDVILDRGVHSRIDEHGLGWVFEKVRPLWEDADLVIVNLESPAGVGGEPLGEKPIRFRTPISFLDALSLGGVGLVSLANNHILDFGPGLALQTEKALTLRGIKSTGLAWRKKKTEPAWVELKGRKLAFFSYCNVCPGEFDAVGKQPGAAVAHPDLMVPDIKRARKKADVVVALMHWGMEYQKTTELQKSLAAKLVDAGADLVIGAHTHVLQDTTRKAKSFVAYSLGNLVFDMYDKRTLDSAVLKVTLVKGRAPAVKAVPLSVKTFRPEPFGKKSKAPKRIRKKLKL